MTSQHDASTDRPFETEIDEAIERGELFFLHQPQVELTTGQVVGTEALIRWFHRDLGMLSPGQFLPRLAYAQSLEGLTHFAVNSAIEQWKSWASTGLEIPISVNVTPAVLASEQFPIWVALSVEAAAIPAGMFKLEITEESLIADGRRAAEVIGYLEGCGVYFSIDDFGAGYSSLSHLLDFDIREVKIDRSFVEAMPTDSRARRIVAALTKLARELGITTVGEGVSSAVVSDALMASGCAIGQGFHLAMPMPACNIPAFLLEPHRPQVSGRNGVERGDEGLYTLPGATSAGSPTNEQTR